MLYKLTLRNAKRSSRNYLIYVVTMTVVATLMFAFNGMMFSKDMQKLYGEMADFIALVGVASFFIILIVIWLLHYMVNFMLEKRSKEFGTYLLLGMQKKQIASMFRKENMVLGLISLLAGILPGILFQIAFTNIFYAVFDEEYRISPDFSIWNLLLTFGMFFCSYFLALIRVKRKFKKMTISKLMYMEKQNEKSINEKRTWKKIFLFFSIIYIIIFNVFALTGHMTMSSVWFYIAGLLMAIYLLYIGLSSFFVSYIKKESKGVYRGANIFVFRQLSSKMKTMRFTMGTMTILFTTSLLAWMVVMMFGDWQNRELERNLLFDVMLISEDTEDDFADELDVITAESVIKEQYIYNIHENGTDVINQYLYHKVQGTWQGDNDGAYFECDTYMGISDYNALRLMIGYDEVELSPDCYLIQSKEHKNVFIEELAADNLILGNHIMYQETITDPFMQSGMNGADYLIIVPDEYLGEMNPYYSVLAVNLEGRTPLHLREELHSLSEWDEWGVSMVFEELKYGYGSSQIISVGHFLIVKEIDAKETGFLMTSLIFILAYIGIVFLCIALTILAVQQLSDSSKYKFRYLILKQLGMNKKETDKVVLKQLGVYYMCPYLISMVLSIFIGMFASERFVFYTGIQASVFRYYFLAAGVFTIIYMVYAMVTYVGFLRNIYS